MELLSPTAHQRYVDLVRALPRVAVGLDFDGTLAPIVADPAAAHIHPDAPALLVELASRVRSLAIITGRPVNQVLALGDLEAVGRAAGACGATLEVYGQYGNEWWTSAQGLVRSPETPPVVDDFLAALPPLLARLGADDAHIERKTLGVAIHTRRTANPETTFDRIAAPITALAVEHGLEVVPGRLVVEAQAPGADKGDAVRRHATASTADGYLFAGDDLGDLPAAEAVNQWRQQGRPGLVVCAASTEEGRLRTVADVAVAGVDGVLALLRDLLRDTAPQGPPQET